MHVHIFHMPIAMHMSDFGEMPICLVSIYGFVKDALDDIDCFATSNKYDFAILNIKIRFHDVKLLQNFRNQQRIGI